MVLDQAAELAHPVPTEAADLREAIQQEYADKNRRKETVPLWKHFAKLV